MSWFRTYRMLTIGRLSTFETLEDMKLQTVSIVLTLAATTAWAAKPPTISGDYVEVRTCNVYAGGCISNGEMGLIGKEAILAWNIRQGAWKTTKLDGLKVVAVVTAQNTLGDQQAAPQDGKAVLILDDRATEEQREALVALARSLMGKLSAEVVTVKSAPIEMVTEPSSQPGVATVKAGNLVQIETFGIAGRRTVCGGHADLVYPPLTAVSNAQVGFAEWAAYRGDRLNRQWEINNVFAAFVATFSR